MPSAPVRPVAAHPVYPDAATVTIGAGEWATDIHVPSDSDAQRLFRAASPRRRA
jgi:hypothetical protein